MSPLQTQERWIGTSQKLLSFSAILWCVQWCRQAGPLFPITSSSMPNDHECLPLPFLKIHILLCSGKDSKLPTVCWSKMKKKKKKVLGKQGGKNITIGKRKPWARVTVCSQVCSSLEHETELCQGRVSGILCPPFLYCGISSGNSILARTILDVCFLPCSFIWGSSTIPRVTQ